MDFGWKWKRWIRGYLSSSRALVLVNGSPAKEFDVTREVRQGGPLAPFLFIIAMEGLHVCMERARELHYFHGLSLPLNYISISHLMYAKLPMMLLSLEIGLKPTLLILVCYFNAFFLPRV